MRLLDRGLLVSFALLAACSATAAQPLGEILGKVSAAYGANAPAAIVESGSTTSLRRGEGKLLRLYQAPDRFRIELGYSSGSETRTIVGANAWQQGAPANPILRDAIALQMARMALPWNLLARRSDAVDLGAATGPAGETLRAVQLPLENGMRLAVEIDPANGHILRSRGFQQVGNNAMEFATVYADFRNKDGRIRAAREEHYAMGRHTGHSIIEKIEYPKSIPDSAFAP